MIPEMVGISVLVGFVAMGFVWYGWGLAENVRAVMRRWAMNGGPSTASQQDTTGERRR